MYGRTTILKNGQNKPDFPKTSKSVFNCFQKNDSNDIDNICVKIGIGYSTVKKLLTLK